MNDAPRFSVLPPFVRPSPEDRWGRAGADVSADASARRLVVPYAAPHLVVRSTAVPESPDMTETPATPVTPEAAAVTPGLLAAPAADEHLPSIDAFLAESSAPEVDTQHAVAATLEIETQHAVAATLEVETQHAVEATLEDDTQLADQVTLEGADTQRADEATLEVDTQHAVEATLEDDTQRADEVTLEVDTPRSDEAAPDVEAHVEIHVESHVETHVDAAVDEAVDEAVDAAGEGSDAVDLGGIAALASGLATSRPSGDPAAAMHPVDAHAPWEEEEPWMDDIMPALPSARPDGDADLAWAHAFGAPAPSTGEPEPAVSAAAAAAAGRLDRLAQRIRRGEIAADALPSEAGDSALLAALLTALLRTPAE